MITNTASKKPKTLRERILERLKAEEDARKAALEKRYKELTGWYNNLK